MINNIKDIYSIVENKSKENAIGQFEVYMSTVKEEEIKIREHSLDAFVEAQSGGVAIKLIKDGKVGFSFTEKLDDDSIVLSFNNAFNSLKYSYSEEEYNHLIEKDTQNSEENYEIVDKDLKLKPIDEIKNIALELEDKLYKLDKRVVNVPMAGASRYSLLKSIMNSRGINKTEKRMSIAYYADIIAKENDNVKTAFNVHASRNAYFNIDELANSIKEEAIGKLKSKPIKSGNFDSIFSSSAMQTLLSAYLGLISSDNVQKKLSLLQDKKNEKIASDIINIYDNPALTGGLGNTHFDGEGLSTKEYSIIENGVLKGFLYNNYTAKKEKIQSTGHAARASYKSQIGISAHNIILKEGSTSRSELISNIKDGVFVTDLMGTHAGVNALSGDFSLQAEGIKIENGELKFHTTPFIVAGNILSFLSSIKIVGNDTEKNRSSIYTPSVLVSDITFSCE